MYISLTCREVVAPGVGVSGEGDERHLVEPQLAQVVGELCLHCGGRGAEGKRRPTGARLNN